MHKVHPHKKSSVVLCAFVLFARGIVLDVHLLFTGHSTAGGVEYNYFAFIISPSFDCGTAGQRIFTKARNFGGVLLNGLSSYSCMHLSSSIHSQHLFIKPNPVIVLIEICSYFLQGRRQSRYEDLRIQEGLLEGK